MTSTDPAPASVPAAPALLDVVSARHVLESAHIRSGVVIDIFRQSRITDGDQYRVEFRGGITEWFWRDELTVHPWADERDIVRTDLPAVRTVLHHAITTASTYLGGTLDTPAPAAAPAD
jgi:hypothetical protein